MNENEISFLIRGAAFKVHNSLGPGLLESVYERALAYELRSLGFEVKQHDKLEGSPRFVPNAFAVAALHAEGIGAVWQLRVTGRPLATGLDPLSVHPFQLVAEAQMLRSAEVHGRVMEFEVLLSRS